jgi:hypothetical protein
MNVLANFITTTFPVQLRPVPTSSRAKLFSRFCGWGGVREANPPIRRSGEPDHLGFEIVPSISPIVRYLEVDIDPRPESAANGNETGPNTGRLT